MKLGREKIHKIAFNTTSTVFILKYLQDEANSGNSEAIQYNDQLQKVNDTQKIHLLHQWFPEFFI